MAEIIISSEFIINGVAQTGLSPTIRIWEINNTDQTLVIGTTEGTNDPGPAGGGPTPGPGAGNDGIMVEVFDKSVGVVGSGGLPIGGSQDGYYKYVFDTVNGYDPSKDYLVKVDGGVALPNNERFQTVNINPTDNLNHVVDRIYDEPIINHLTPGSVGFAINTTNTNTTQLLIDLIDVENLLDLLLKFDTNRTKIDKLNKELIIYDDDCTTVLRKFKLLDAGGTPSVTDMCERKPIAATDGLPICP